MRKATAHSRARHNPDLTVRKIEGVISSTNIFTATSAPASARRINAAGPRSLPNSFSNKASSARLRNNLRADGVALFSSRVYIEREVKRKCGSNRGYTAISSFDKRPNSLGSDARINHRVLFVRFRS